MKVLHLILSFDIKTLILPLKTQKKERELLFPLNDF